MVHGASLTESEVESHTQGSHSLGIKQPQYQEFESGAKGAENLFHNSIIYSSF